MGLFAELGWIFAELMGLFAKFGWIFAELKPIIAEPADVLRENHLISPN
jgi:hypothetical protein